MKKWIQDRLKSIKHGWFVVRSFTNWKATLAYVALVVQWLLSYQSAWHFIVTLAIAAFIDCVAFKQGMKAERIWSAKL